MKKMLVMLMLSFANAAMVPRPMQAADSASTIVTVKNSTLHAPKQFEQSNTSVCLCV